MRSCQRRFSIQADWPIVATPVNPTPSRIAPLRSALEPVTDFHEREAEQVKAQPSVRGRGPFVVSTKADSPDPVLRRGLDEHPVTGAEQELAQIGVLPEFRHVPGDDQVKAVRHPALLLECPHLPTSFFAAPGCGASRIRAAISASPNSSALAAIMKCSAEA